MGSFRSTDQFQQMTHVEARVRSALSKKDEALKEAKDQIMALRGQLNATEKILEEQRALVEEEYEDTK